MRKYYVQAIADNYLKNLSDEPEEYLIHSSHLYGYAEADMVPGLRALHGLMRRLYEGVADAPEQFSMLLKESLEPDAKTVEYTQSNQSLLRVPNLLYVLGIYGELTPDGSLAMEGKALLEAAKIFKITRMQALLSSLRDYGCTIDGFSKAIVDSDEVIVGYPDNRFLPLALKAMACAMLAANKNDPKKGRERFYSMDVRMLEGAPGKPPKRTIDDFYHVLTPENRAIAKRLHEAIAPYAKPVITQSGIMRNDWGCVYTLSLNKRIVLTLNANQDQMLVKMNLANIGKYTDVLDAAPEEIVGYVLNAWECGHCNSGCAGGFAFRYQGRDYNKCRGGSFQFPSVRAEWMEDCLTLLMKEVNVVAQNV